MDKYYITLGKLSCVCGSVRISNYQNHITKIVTFSASLLLRIQWYLFKDGFSKAHQLNYTVQGGNVSFVSDVTWLHNRHYPVIWMYSLTCIQPGGGDDHADQRKALRTQSICSRSMVRRFFMAFSYHENTLLPGWMCPKSCVDVAMDTAHCYIADQEIIYLVCIAVCYAFSIWLLTAIQDIFCVAVFLHRIVQNLVWNICLLTEFC